MKNKFKFLLFSLSLALLSPLVTDAATLSFDGTPNNNTATYEIKYAPSNGETLNTINIDVDKTNDDLTYNLTLANGISGECTNLKCNNIITAAYTTGAEVTLATLTIQNTTNENQKTTITLSGNSVDGTLTTATKEFTLKPMSTTTTTTTAQRVLNSDNTLSGINVSVGNLDQNFNKDLLEYSVTGIKDTVNSITITPTCAAEGCTWTMSCPLGECSVTNPNDKARISLQNGANKVSIVVTSEDKKSNKTYILNIYRGEVTTSSAYLSGLEVTDAILSPNFDSMTNDYSLTVGLDVEKLDIITTTEDPSAKVLIKGNENLKEGENTITITVTSSDGENKQVYTLLVTKEEIEEVIEEEKEEVTTSKIEKKKNNTWLIILLSLIGITLIVVAFIIIFKKKKNNKNNKNDKNDKGISIKNNNKEVLENSLEDDLMNASDIEKENTANLHILNETRRQLHEEPRQDIDEALDDLMKTKRLELGDLDF